ncbi:hypothetical protein F5884DRAFT_440466 [Xylogone sp. PMI_703]|nr:hypothetical protein F5884DRAFT_440466 [Xylogone sp. PMI_703]
MPSTSKSTSTTSPDPVVTDQAVIASFNRGPVTSVFVPPASCLSTLTKIVSMYFGHEDGDYYDPACFPSSTIPESKTQWDLFYYSPAQCPQGWSEATTFTSSFTGHHDSTLSLGADTTAVLCCPSGYSYLDYNHRCASGFADITTYLTFYSPISGDDAWTKGPVLTDQWVQGTSTWTIFGDGIPVWYQSSDLALFRAATATKSSTTSSTSTSTSPTSTSTSPATSTPTSNSSSGLSTGAKIGIGVGIPLAVLALGIIGFAYYMRRRRKNRVLPTELQGLGRKEMTDAEELAQPHVVHELYTDNEPPEPGELPAR